MPSAPLSRESTFLARGAGLCIFSVLLLGCREEAPRGLGPRDQAPARASAAPARTFRPAPGGDFACEELRAAPAENAVIPESIELRPPGAGKSVFTSKMGVFVSFNRDEFLKAARCLKYEQAIRYIEEDTGFAEQTAIMDAFQLSYVAAALLDAGRAGVRLDEEAAFRKTIVRDGWAADGCAGRCRSFGRLYRLSADDSSFFLRITDNTKYHSD
jgi:hypothetical protein